MKKKDNTPATSSNPINIPNRTIFTGDNLEVMRGINSASVDLIYLDPPFNSNANYSAPIGSMAAGAAFKDTWTLDDVDLAWHGLIAEEHPALYRVIDTAGLSHSKGMKSYLIMMAVRLLEMRRVLKDTGSIYLHCDPTASHYLKLVMDCIFGRENFRNEIVWHYDGPQGPSKQNFGTKHDVIIRYSKSKDYFANADGIIPFQPLTESDLSQYQRDNEGRYYYTTPKGNYTDASIARLEGEGRIHWTRNGKPRVKHFLPEIDGVLGRQKQLPDVWNDIYSLGHVGKKENVGYPTQKPLALLERIIKASSNEGDVVLDPFCGCATACVAAEKLNRKWIGIDLSQKAYELVYYRLGNMGLESELGSVIHRSDIAKRTDLGNIPKYTTHKHTLFGKQEGICAGCEEFFPFRNFTVDHILPRAKGGTDHESNLQLLCNACNSMKGVKSQEEFMVLLKERGLRK